MEHELPSGWTWTTIAELGQVVSGGTPSTKEASYWGGNIAWISPSDLTGYAEKFICRGAKSLTSDGLKNSSAKVMPAGSVHFSSRAPIGYTAISSCDMTTNQGFKSLVPATGIFNEFIYYYLKASKQRAESVATGTTFKEISGAAFAKLPVPLPPTSEQRRIVAKIEELFSELDKGIESLKTAQAQLKVYRQALLKHAFEGKLTAQWRADNPDKLETADALLERIHQERAQRYQQQLADWEAGGKQDSKPKSPKPLPPLTIDEVAGLPELPEGWGWVKLGSLASKITDGEHFKPAVKTEGVYFLSAKDVRDNGVSFDDPLFIDEETARKARSRCDPARNDILIVSRGATVGRMCIVNTDKYFCLLGSVILIKAIRVVHSKYCLAALKSPSVNRDIIGVSGATAQQAIYLRDIQHVPVPICSFEEQRTIIEELDSKLSEADQLDQTITTSLQQAEALRQSILKKAFSGRLVPQDASDEPASMLLARINAEKAEHLERGRPRKLQAVPVQPVPDKGKVLAFPARVAGISATDLHAGVLAMAYRLHEQDSKRVVNFGHVKAEKISHLIESHLGIDLERIPFKDAAGPNDYPHLKKVESRARKANWFDVRQQKAGGAYVFSRKPGFDGLLNKTANALGGRLPEVDALLQVLLPLNIRQAEIVATLYAAWNNLLLTGKAAADEDIVHEARENWHEAKLDIEREKFFRGLEWMRKKGLAPAGRGRYVAEKTSA